MACSRARRASASRAAREVIERAVASGEAVYGVNTGFGNLANVRIADADLETLQERLVLSHAAGMGEPLPDAAVRGMLLLRANTLAKRALGRASAAHRRAARVAEHGPPARVVPSRGSVGASGDLAPLAHLALPLLGRSRVRRAGKLVPAAEALRDAGLAPIRLAPREGLGLVNGTQAMTSLLALSALEARRLVRVADLVGALSTDALRGTDAAFDARDPCRPAACRANSPVRAISGRLLQGSRSAIPIATTTCGCRIPTPCAACRRCMVRSATRWATSSAPGGRDELGDRQSTGLRGATTKRCQAGTSTASRWRFAADFLAIALAELGSISERRTEKLTNDDVLGAAAFPGRERRCSTRVS